MKIASFCIKHKVTTILAFVIIAVFGVVFYSNLKLALMPNMEFPAAYVMCTYAGAGPEDVEELVTRPLESCVSTLSGVDTISSTSSENVSMVMIPIALSGALFGLPITGMDLSMIVLLALIMLVGTVVNSSIVLIDYINIRRARGQEKDEAIMEACPLRVRPIMMTTLTTVLALIPMAIGSGEGNEMLQPMGVVMISGMVISTVVTLLFTPVYYSVLDSLSERMKKPLQMRRARKTENLLAQIAAAEKAASVGEPKP